MPKAPSRQSRFDAAQAKACEAKNDMEELRDELQNWLDNLPENLQSGSKAQELEDAIGELETAISGLEEAENASPNFPGMFA